MRSVKRTKDYVDGGGGHGLANPEPLIVIRTDHKMYYISKKLFYD